LRRSDPDVIVLDIEMPEMDGLTALPALLEAKPNLKIIMASTVTHRNAEISLRALSLGASDCIGKPEGDQGLTTAEDFRRELCDKVRALGRAGRAGGGGAVPAATAERDVSLATEGEAFALRAYHPVEPRILVIGSSTGGPHALLQVMKSIAPSLERIPVVITQHMPATFTAILAGHIALSCGLPTKEAEDGEAIRPGHVYVAPGGRHLVLKRTGAAVCTRLTNGPPVNFCKPAVDPMFESAVAAYRNAILALILTGMGSDGCKGARAIADAGGNVFAQDKATSVVWGMPGTAAMAGVCCGVLPLDQIGPRMSRAVRGIA
jgi:two-component system chemotaxis response regulator CheB